MIVYSVYILNKAGGLVYQNDINPGLNRLSANDYLVLAGTLHGVHAITSRFSHSMKIEQNEINMNNNSNILSTGKSLNPNTNKTGLQSIETDHFNLYIQQSLTGIKFIIITSPLKTTAMSRGQLNTELELVNYLFKQIYILYGDYVSKDPFQASDMPIKNQLFDTKLRELVNQ